MKGTEFIRAIRRLGRRRGVSVHVVAGRGKGDRVTLFYGAPARSSVTAKS
ncbi:MAG TPA: hypothetical protein VKT70_09025 [Stellaceae bacterium]|nr:hypothetical protein [Stellaceae bacterium]